MLTVPHRTFMLLILICAVLPVGCSRAPLTKEHAKERFLEIARKGCAGNYKEMDDVLRAIFQKGTPASEYEDILKTANSKTHDPNGFGGAFESNGADTLYIWDINDGQDGAAFYVYTAGSLPVVVGYRIAIFDK